MVPVTFLTLPLSLSASLPLSFSLYTVHDLSLYRLKWIILYCKEWLFHIQRASEYLTPVLWSPEMYFLFELILLHLYEDAFDLYI